MADVSLVDQHTNTVREALARLTADEHYRNAEENALHRSSLSSLAWLAGRAATAGSLEAELQAERERFRLHVETMIEPKLLAKAGRAHQLEQDVREAAEAEEHLTARARSDADYEGAAIHSHCRNFASDAEFTLLRVQARYMRFAPELPGAQEYDGEYWTECSPDEPGAFPVWRVQ